MNEYCWGNSLFRDCAVEPILRDVFVGWNLGNGIFNYLANVGNLPWEEDTSIDSDSLDLAYFGNHSGAKFCSPIVKSLLNADGEVPNAARETLAKILLAKYLPNWNHLWGTITAEYSPIHNYDMTEDRTLKRANSEAESENGTEANTGTDTFTYGKKETITHGKTSHGLTSRYGINTDTDDPKPSDSTEIIDGGTTETENSGDDVDEKDLLTTRANNRNKVGADEEQEHLRRLGNIGVTTTQQMLESERNLWKWNFFDTIFRDIDNEFALAFHDSCRV